MKANAWVWGFLSLGQLPPSQYSGSFWKINVIIMIFKGFLTTLVTKFKCLGMAHKALYNLLPADL